LPELPEVETVTADLRPHLVGRVLAGCDVRFPSIVRHPSPEAFAAGVRGRRIESMSRRGKYILHHLDSGELLVVHLGMTGQWRYVPASTEKPTHLHAVFPLDDGFELRYRDVRRFGRLLLGTDSELVAERKMPRLGPEPIDSTFTAGDFYRRLHVRRAPLKTLLLDQMVVAGVGNIYADEALFRAGIHPLRPAGALTRAQLEALRDAIEASLRDGIDAKGATIDDFRHVDGAHGSFQDRFLVHLREGEPCVRCGATIVKMFVAGRGTYVCETCQARPRVRPPGARPAGRSRARPAPL
jgi:formamidopyrimidine-DNA glycosylase